VDRAGPFARVAAEEVEDRPGFGQREWGRASAVARADVSDPIRDRARGFEDRPRRRPGQNGRLDWKRSDATFRREVTGNAELRVR
jgi:hypothetical protein